VTRPGELPTSPDDTGTFAIECTCGTWRATGTAREVLDHAAVHDDDHVLDPGHYELTPS
jgi:hypothetical protein